MDVEKIGEGNFAYYKGTFDCPAQITLSDTESVDVIVACGCCSFDDGSKVKSPDDCRYRSCGNSPFGFQECSCSNTMIIHGTCLSKRNHGACPYGLKGTEKITEDNWDPAVHGYCGDERKKS